MGAGVRHALLTAASLLLADGQRCCPGPKAGRRLGFGVGPNGSEPHAHQTQRLTSGSIEQVQGISCPRSRTNPPALKTGRAREFIQLLLHGKEALGSSR